MRKDKDCTRQEVQTTHIVISRYRFSMLTDGLVRIEYAIRSGFCDDLSLMAVNRNFAPVAYKLDIQGDTYRIITPKIDIELRNDGLPLSQNNLKVMMKIGDDYRVWHPGAYNEHNLKGTCRTLDETDGEVNLEDGILSRDGWTMIDDSQSPVFIDSERQILRSRMGSEDTDWYLFVYGTNYKNALRDYTMLSGAIALPPRFTFGYWWSRYWAYSDMEVRKLVQDFQKHRLPLDVIVIDMDWHYTEGVSMKKPVYDSVGELQGWTGYSWNKELFPNPKELINWLHSQGIKVALNLHPASGVNANEDNFASFNEAMGGCVTDNYPFFPENKDWVDAYFQHIIRPLEGDGVDFWWLDWQAWLMSKHIDGLNITWWLNHLFASRMQRGRRPMLFHRWGGLGNHRYQIGFSGDTWISWRSLSYLPYFTATSANVCYGYWSHDIGGHMGAGSTPELYLRWLQYGAFSPILRTHATKSKDLERRIWEYPDLYDTMREAMETRHRLVAYLYTQAWKATQNGISLCRAMYLEHPDCEEAYEYHNQYYFGDQMLVSPIVQASDEDGLVDYLIWIPPGEWYDTVYMRLVSGPKVITQRYALDDIPVFIKSGAIIPMLSEEQNVGDRLSRLALDVYPGSEGEGILYDDAGDGAAWEYGENSIFNYYSQRIDDTLKVSIGHAIGAYEGQLPVLDYTLNLVSAVMPQKVIIDGVETSDYRFDITIPSVVINLGKKAINRKISVLIIGYKYLTEGMAFTLKRASKVIPWLKEEQNRIDVIANLPRHLQYLDGLSAFLNYNPLKIEEIGKEFDKIILEAIQAVMILEGFDSKLIRKCIRYLDRDKYISPEPEIKIESIGLKHKVVVTHNTGVVRWTNDSSEPCETSPKYIEPLQFTGTYELLLKSFDENKLPSFTKKIVLLSPWVKQAIFSTKPHKKYRGKNYQRALFDGSFGKVYDYSIDWLGFEAKDLEIRLELCEEAKLKGLEFRFLCDQRSWIFYPVEIRIDKLEDDCSKSLASMDYSYEANTQCPEPKLAKICLEFGTILANSIVVILIRNMGRCPAWHRAAGGDAWFFIDEIIPIFSEEVE